MKHNPKSDHGLLLIVLWPWWFIWLPVFALREWLLGQACSTGGGVDRTEGIREHCMGEEMKHNIWTPAQLCSQSSDCFLCAKTQYKTDTFRGVKTKEWVGQNTAERPTCKYQLHKNSGFPPTHSFGIVSGKEITSRNLCYPGVKLGSHYDLCVMFPSPSVAET